MVRQEARSFGKLDYAFHEKLCGIAEVDYAFDVILEEKSKIDRLCMLGIEKVILVWLWFTMGDGVGWMDGWSCFFFFFFFFFFI